MTCPKQDDLSAYMDHMLAPVERERLAGHVLSCAICKARLNDLTALRQSLRELPSPVLGFDLAARLEERLHAAPARRRPARPFWPIWVSGGASTVLALASGIWLGTLLVGGGASVPSAALTLRVFDPVPPGGLCAAPELCRLPKGMQ